MDELIKLQNIYKEYGIKVKTMVLKDINLGFNKGEYVGIIGQSGSGKSTLLNLIGALDRPTSGDIYINGKNLMKLDDNELAKFRNETMGFVFQFHYLLPEFNVLENVLIPYRIAHGLPNKQIIDLAKELIDRVGVSDRIYNKSTDISGGQQQRVAIARALINRPDIILADEPTGNLDSNSSAEVNKLLREINREYKTTFIIVTHDRHIAAQCDRVIEMVDGYVQKDYLTSAMTADENWSKLAPKYCKYACKNADANVQ